MWKSEKIISRRGRMQKKKMESKLRLTDNKLIEKKSKYKSDAQVWVYNLKEFVWNWIIGISQTIR